MSFIRFRSAKPRGWRTAVGALLACWAAAAEWPEFRGPTGQGVAAAETAPLRWGESENVVWKTAIPGRGWSSPVLQDGRIWLTTATDEGRSLRAIAVDAASGQILHEAEVFRLGKTPGIHQKNSHASPTPILEPDRVYVHFGPQGTAALDAEGRVLWRNQEHSYRPGHGAGGSPVVWRDLLIFSADGVDSQAVVALDKNSGETRWKSPRPGRMAFSTPAIVPGPDGDQVVSVGGDRAVAYDPATGREIWRVTYEGFSNVPRPVYGRDLVYLTTGFYRPVVLAVRLDGRGDVTQTHVAWEAARGVPLTPSPLLVDDALYLVSDNGIASRLDARTGEYQWQKRLGGAFSASPLYADGRIYFTNEGGETIVIAHEPQFRELARNQVNGRTLASLAVVDGVLYLRSETQLYRVEEP